MVLSTLGSLVLLNLILEMGTVTFTLLNLNQETEYATAPLNLPNASGMLVFIFVTGATSADV